MKSFVWNAIEAAPEEPTVELWDSLRLMCPDRQAEQIRLLEGRTMLRIYKSSIPRLYHDPHHRAPIQGSITLYHILQDQ